jgi:hypothetical protein
MMAIGYIRSLADFFRGTDEYYEIWFSELFIFPARVRNGYIHNKKYISIISPLLLLLSGLCTVLYSHIFQLA